MDNESTSISLGDIFRVIKKNILIIIAIVAIITTLGAVYTFKGTTPHYTSTSSIVVQVPAQSGQSQNPDYDINTSLRYVDTVKDMILENTILDPIAAKYELSYGAIRSKVSVSNSEFSSLIRIRVEDIDSARAMNIANEIADTCVKEANADGLFFFAVGYIKQSGIAQEGVYSSPNKPLLLMCSVLIGAVVAFAVVFIKEFMSKKFKTKDDIEATLNEKVIGTFINNKKLDENGKKRSKKNRKASAAHLFNLINPTIREMEPYNKLLTNIIYSNIDSPHKTIMVTSSIMNELKSTTAVNLAYCMANNKKKVIILDLDLRLSTVHKFFNLDKDNGIVEYLDGSINLDTAIKHTEFGVDFISAGKNIINPVVILESHKLEDLINKLRESYDYIIIDTPPVSVCTDAIIASKLCDGIIYNVSINMANKSLVKESLKSLKNINAPIIGINVTKMEELSKSEYYSYYSEYNNTQKNDANEENE